MTSIPLFERGHLLRPVRFAMSQFACCHIIVMFRYSEALDLQLIVFQENLPYRLQLSNSLNAANIVLCFVNQGRLIQKRTRSLAKQ